MTKGAEKWHVCFTEETVGADNSVQTETRARQITAEQTRLAYAQVPVAFVVTCLNASVLVLVLQQVVTLPTLLVWLTSMFAIALTRLMMARWYLRAVPNFEQSPFWRALFICGAISAGCCWGATSIFLFPTGSFSHQMFLTFILGGMSIGAVASLAAVRSAYVGFLLATTLPIVVRFFLQEGDLSIAMGVLSLIFVAALLAMGLRVHSTITESLALRFERRDLLQSQETLQQSNEELERRVQARTAELMAANSALHAEINERERAEEELRGSESRSRAMLRALPDIVFRLSRGGEYLDYKAEPGAGLFAPPEIFLGKKIGDILPPSVAQQSATAIAEALRTGKTQVFEYALALQRGPREFEARIAVSGVDEVVAIVRDITERKEVDRLKDEFISIVSHELRTPLTSLRGFTELMLTRHFPPEKQRELLSIMQKEATRLTALINDFLDLQRMESGQQSYRRMDVDLATILHASVALFTNSTESHIFRIQIPEHLPPVQADADRLHQVLINLLSNAVKFSPQGGIITTAIRCEGNEVFVSVADQGIGIPAEELPKVFDRFFRVDNRDIRNIGGTGLGLTLVKDIIASHGGRVWAESAPRQGSTFFFALPVSGKSKISLRQV
jgi:signal transduction histidine kinase